jgi:hypothetical protein
MIDAKAWPPRMTTRQAAAYCGYSSPFGLLAAFRRGRVRPFGRRGGGRGTLTWDRAELDAFMRGAGDDAAAAGE